MAAALLIAVFVYSMPAEMAGRAALFGDSPCLLPIGWIVLNIILASAHRQNGSLGYCRIRSGITEDRRIQLPLIAFSFGAFFEGAAGRTPVLLTIADLRSIVTNSPALNCKVRPPRKEARELLKRT